MKAELETMPWEKKKQYLNRKLKELVKFGYEKSPSVKERFANAGISPLDIRSITDLVKLPPMHKAELLEYEKAAPPFGGFLTMDLSEVGWVFVSPGPVYEPMPGQIETKMRSFIAAGIGRGDIVLNTISYHLVPAGVLFDHALRRLGAVVIPAGVGNTDMQVQIMRDLGVTAYVGTPSFLKILIERAEQLGFDVKGDFALRRASVTAEMLPESLRRELEDKYGINVVQDFGVAELGSIAYECSEKCGMHAHEEAIIEIIDPQGRQLAPGEIGELVVTVLRKDFPLIRYGTHDLSSLTVELCPCGRTSPRLTGILGRVDQVTKVRGMFLHPKQLMEAISKISCVGNFRAIVERVGARDTLKIEVEIKEAEPKLDENKLKAELETNIRDLCRLKVDEIWFVPAGSIAGEEAGRIKDKRVW
jgi:phenylacetate-CoA ligase